MKTFSEFISEAKRTIDIGKHTGDPVPYKNLSPKNRYKLEKQRRENLKKRPGDPPGDSRLIQAFRQRAKDEGNYAS